MPIRNGKYARYFLVFLGVLALFDWWIIPFFLGLPPMTNWR
jgi:hypothetical protein